MKAQAHGGLCRSVGVRNSGPQLRASNKTPAQPPGERGRCSESSCTTRTLRFLGSFRAHLTAVRYVLSAALNRKDCSAHALARVNLTTCDDASPLLAQEQIVQTGHSTAQSRPSRSATPQLGSHTSQ
ncbi:conserved hypothetical protein [Xanthomonas campestris pv. campestris str. 8004]|uniref:Uncharacterized protein n=2 Tax=Xanthomonas campestris pv. campestris TaxID=340 RepID=Q8PDE3_XANCP|nr:conserved hypothetical protein [Xanthomonas campestris pv. campestris str. ATCC 33913]AAY47492.1 conserved hypothetical protein [Xanthomonas campestris pv. campestris str. 8004]AKS14808.1 hypothetical protein AEA00_02000 [Xanthomonas campestris pv. campestris]